LDRGRLIIDYVRGDNLKSAWLCHSGPSRAYLNVTVKTGQVHALATTEGRESTRVGKNLSAGIEILRNLDLSGSARACHRNTGWDASAHARPKVAYI
jgi:hypothetical protein